MQGCGYVKLNYAKGSIPLYLQIYEILKDKIEKQVYEYGDMIPSEQELEKLYKVSRITVRQAIGELEKAGYVKRARGKGTAVTYVKRIDESLSAIRSFTKEMEDRGLQPGTSFVQIQKEEADDEVASLLELPPHGEVYHLWRVRTADQEPLVIFETYLSGEYDFPLEEENYHGSMYQIFEDLGIRQPAWVRENFQAILASQEIAELLDVKIGSPIFKRIRIAYSEENKAIEYTISYYRGDRYSYSIELGKHN